MSPLFDRRIALATDTSRLKALRAEGYRIYATVTGEDGTTHYLQRPRPSEEAAADTGEVDPLDSVVGRRAGDALRAGGFPTLDAARAASDDDLLAAEGFGPASLDKLRNR